MFNSASSQNSANSFIFSEKSSGSALGSMRKTKYEIRIINLK
jgi:hypothetical protein